MLGAPAGWKYNAGYMEEGVGRNESYIFPVIRWALFCTIATTTPWGTVVEKTEVVSQSDDERLSKRPKK